jgi:hypothetical protein
MPLRDDRLKALIQRHLGAFSLQVAAPVAANASPLHTAAVAIAIVDEGHGAELPGFAQHAMWSTQAALLKSVGGKPRSRRAPVDHSVYSWKGYQSWADRVRQSWEPEEN